MICSSKIEQRNLQFFCAATKFDAAQVFNAKAIPERAADVNGQAWKFADFSHAEGRKRGREGPKALRDGSRL